MEKWIVVLLIFSTVNVYSFIRNIDEVYSPTMNRRIPVTIILPSSYTEERKYSVVYGLHGWGGSFRTFGRVRNIEKLADELNLIFVFPDGRWNSWYIDSKIKEDSNYSTFVSRELIEYVDKKYSTIKDRKQRAITGFSMGGFGALYNGLKNQEIFGNIGSISGGLDVEHFRNKWGIWKVIDDNWYEYNIKDILDSLKKIEENTNIIMDCGDKDFFLESNREVHKKLEKLDISHKYSERTGSHNKKYWSESLERQIRFFSERFDENKI